MTRAPEPDVEVAVLGAGFSGLGMAAALLREGKRRFAVLEKADEVGGTWRDNSYPGCACDIPSHLYSFSFAPKTDWSRMYPPQPEILDYLRDVADRFGVRPHIRFGAQVAGMAWDEAAGFWRVALADGGEVTAHVVASGMGGLHVPAFPDIPGRASFAGPSFHSAQWRHDVDLTGKRVAIVGTGASAIQFVPQIQPKVARLDLYQRTPAWILPKGDRAMAEWEKRLFDIAPAAQEGYRRAIYLLNEVRAFAFIAQNPRLIAKAQAMALRHLHDQVADPALRAALTPAYAIGCKRVLIANDFYPAVTQPNVTLVTEPIEAIDAAGVRTADGAHRPADVMIYATGFSPMSVDVEVRGRDGESLAQAWRDGPQAHLGLTVAGFPNLFFLMGPNTGLGHNSMVYMIESQIAFVMDALALMDARDARTIEVRAEAQADFNADLARRLSRTIWASGCASWYVAADGRNATTWPGFTFDYRARTRTVPQTDYVTA